jgi:hypothetical protein
MNVYLFLWVCWGWLKPRVLCIQSLCPTVDLQPPTHLKNTVTAIKLKEFKRICNEKQFDFPNYLIFLPEGNVDTSWLCILQGYSTFKLYIYFNVLFLL